MSLFACYKPCMCCELIPLFLLSWSVIKVLLEKTKMRKSQLRDVYRHERHLIKTVSTIFHDFRAQRDTYNHSLWTYLIKVRADVIPVYRD